MNFKLSFLSISFCLIFGFLNQKIKADDPSPERKARIANIIDHIRMLSKEERSRLQIAQHSLTDLEIEELEKTLEKLYKITQEPLMPKRVKKKRKK